MKKRTLSVMFALVFLSLTLVGCASAPALPDGDVKVVKQEVTGVINLLLKSADYGQKSTTVASMVLPKDAQYKVNITLETFEGGNSTGIQEITSYTTQMMKDDSITHIIMNAGNGEVPSIFSISEVDEEKTVDPKVPEFKMTKTYLPALEFDAKTDVAEIGMGFGEEFILTGYVKFKADDAKKVSIDLTKYEDEVMNYDKVYLLKGQVTQVTEADAN